MSETEESGSDQYGEVDNGQLEPEDTLIDRGVEDYLDEGYTAGERWSTGEGFGNTVDEQREGESLDQRVPQEVAEGPTSDGGDDAGSDAGGEDVGGEVGNERAGRLIAPDEGLGEDVDKDLIAGDVGIDGAGASAEEAAMHVIDDETAD